MPVGLSVIKITHEPSFTYDARHHFLAFFLHCLGKLRKITRNVEKFARASYYHQESGYKFKPYVEEIYAFAFSSSKSFDFMERSVLRDALREPVVVLVRYLQNPLACGRPMTRVED